MFSFSMQFLSIAPQYTTFGSQLKADGEPCGLRENSTKLQDARIAGHNLCEMTAISSFYNKIILSMPIFSILYFWLSWAYVGFFTLFLFYSLSKKPEKNFTLRVRFNSLISVIAIWWWGWSGGFEVIYLKWEGLIQSYWILKWWWFSIEVRLRGRWNLISVI